MQAVWVNMITSLKGTKLLEETIVLRGVFVTSKIIQGKWTLLRLDFTCHKRQLEGQEFNYFIGL